jgi:hypothetical protein
MFYLKIPNIFTRDPKTHQTTEEFSEDAFKYLYKATWYALEKIDGTNICVNWDGHRVSYTGRQEKSTFTPEQKAVLDDMFMTTAFEELCESTFGEKTATVFGEFAGKTIQKVGSLYNPDNFFIAFDVVVGETWCQLETAVEICRGLGLDFVYYKEDTLENIVSEIKEKNTTQSFYNPAAPLEGYVCRPRVNLFDYKGKPVRVKVKHESFKR